MRMHKCTFTNDTQDKEERVSLYGAALAAQHASGQCWQRSTSAATATQRRKKFQHPKNLLLLVLTLPEQLVVVVLLLLLLLGVLKSKDSDVGMS